MPSQKKPSAFAQQAVALIGAASEGTNIKAPAAQLLHDEARIHQKTTIPAAAFQFLLHAAKGKPEAGVAEAKKLVSK